MNLRTPLAATFAAAALAWCGSAALADDDDFHHGHHGHRGHYGGYDAFHDELDHREYHRELIHRDAHRYPMSRWQHDRLVDQLDHERFHDQLLDRQYHRTQPYSYRTRSFYTVNPGYYHPRSSIQYRTPGFSFYYQR